MEPRFTPLTPADRPRLVELCRLCSDFFELTEGRPGGEPAADELLGPLPPQVTRGVKSAFLIEDPDGTLIGVTEILDGYPEDAEWYIGLLLLHRAPLPRVGARVYAALRQRMTAAGARVIRVAVQKSNPRAKTFWERQGFTLEQEMTARVGHHDLPVWRLLWRAAPEPAGR